MRPPQIAPSVKSTTMRRGRPKAATATTPIGMMSAGAISIRATQREPRRRRTRCHPSTMAPTKKAKSSGTSGRRSRAALGDAFGYEPRDYQGGTEELQERRRAHVAAVRCDRREDVVGVVGRGAGHECPGNPKTDRACGERAAAELHRHQHAAFARPRLGSHRRQRCGGSQARVTLCGQGACEKAGWFVAGRSPERVLDRL
jgi:hypothetical protein